MKTPEQALAEWMLNEIHFDAGGKRKILTREEITQLSGYLTSKDTIHGSGARKFCELGSVIAVARMIQKAGLAEMFQVTRLLRFSGLDEIMEFVDSGSTGEVEPLKSPIKGVSDDKWLQILSLSEVDPKNASRSQPSN